MSGCGTNISADGWPNKPDAANPAMTLWLTIEHQWRRVADLERWAPPVGGMRKAVDRTTPTMRFGTRKELYG